MQVNTIEMPLKVVNGVALMLSTFWHSPDPKLEKFARCFIIRPGKEKT
jgi:hypothetical protein